MSATSPARTVAASGTAIGGWPDGGTRNTLTVPRTEFPSESASVNATLPNGPSVRPSRSAMASSRPRSRISEWSTTEAASTVGPPFGAGPGVAEVTSSTRPVVFCTAPRTSMSASSPWRR